uniref:Glycosyltransferase n=1 Tax=Aegilops tauschii subsp. strangulata TaxID=200361 RepID=A0A453M7I1_AEGTS
GRRFLILAAAHRGRPVARVRPPAPVPGALRAARRARPPRVLRLHAAQPRSPPDAAPSRGAAHGPRRAPAPARRRPPRRCRVHQRCARRQAGAPLQGLRRPRRTLRGVHGRRVRRRGHKASLGHRRLLPPLGRRRRLRAQGSADLRALSPSISILPQLESMMYLWGQLCVRSFSQPSDRARAPPRYEQEGRQPIYCNHGVSGMSIMQRLLLTKERCTVVAIRSCVEWEPESFPLAATILGKPVVPLGLLPPSADAARCAAANGAEHATVRWLDAQPPGSVLYVALGSEVPLRVEQVHELALGLELAGTRFLWALRKASSAGAAVDTDILPPGFQERTRGQGLVTTAWVPQMSILAHAAVGGFLTHCGRSSLIEGLLFGHPLVMLPIFGDQGPNARQMEAKKVGLQVARDENDGSFDRHGVAVAVRAVMAEGEARSGFLAGAARMQEVVADAERHERYIDEFVQQLRSYSAAGATN